MPIMAPQTKRTIEITVSATGKIPRRNFENYAPMFVVKEIIEGADLTDQVRLARQQELYAQCEGLFNRIRENLKLEELQEQFKNLRFTLNPADGKRYPHTTDILYWDAEFYINPDELAQYGARGGAIHSMIEHWISTKEWVDSAINKRDLILLKNGSLQLYNTLTDINFLGFMKEYGEDIRFDDGEFLAFNQQYFYCGRPDRLGAFKKVPSIFDFKCRAAQDDDFKQMAAYLNLEDPRLKNVKQMVIIPLNPQNKSGFGKPVVSDEIEKCFNLFLRDREDFKDKFGI